MMGRLKNVKTFILFLFFTIAISLCAYAKSNQQICDYAKLFTEEEKNTLLQEIDGIRNIYDLDIVFVTVNSLNGKTAQEYAEDFYVSGNYGIGSEKSGVLFLLSMNERQYWTTTHGYGIYVFTDYGIEYINKEVSKKLSDEKYFEAFQEYLKITEELLKEAKSNKPYDTNNTIKDDTNNTIKGSTDYIIAFSIVFVIAALIAFTIAHFIKKSMKVNGNKLEADEYMKEGSFKLTNSNDLFLYSNVVSQKISNSDNSSSSDSGSSTHDSNDTKFGGGGGSF